MANPKNRSDNSDSKTEIRGPAEKSVWDIGARIFELLNGRDLQWLSRETSVPTSTLSDFLRKGGKAETAIRIAEKLDTTVEYLLRGTARRAVSLIDADEAEWLKLPRYDLAGFTPEGKPDPIEVVPIRRPWLRGVDTPATGLWLTTLPTTIPNVANEGDTVICRDAEADLVDGRTYIFMRDQSVLVRRVAIDSQGFSLISGDPSTPTIQLGRRDPPSPDEQIVPVARIVALLGIRMI